jgi:hypothetical protein
MGAFESFLTSSKGKNWTTPVLLIIFGLMEPANSSLSRWPTDQGCDCVSAMVLGGEA